MKRIISTGFAAALLLMGQSLMVQFPTSRYAFSFTNAVSVSIAGSVHRLETADLTVQCYDTSNPALRIGMEPDHWTIDPNTFDVVIYFAESVTSGRCVLR